MTTFIDAATVDHYTTMGWWGTTTVSDLIRSHARENPQGRAYVTPSGVTTWTEYDDYAQELARTLVGLGIAPGARVAMLLPDTVDIHATMVATSRAGLVAVGIGARAGDAEIAHLLTRTGARVLVTMASHRGRTAGSILDGARAHGAEVELHVVLDRGVSEVRDARAGARRVAREVEDAELAGLALGPNDLSMLNSTSGTTGLPKCVTQFENRWLYFSRLAVESGALGRDEVFLGAVPAPFGFGLWTSHFVGTTLGAPTVVMPRFSTDEMIELIERERVTVLSCVSTQFKMLLNSPKASTADLSSLRVMYTGGEAVPYAKAAEFEERTGATVLQFFGSNETGALSYTTLTDSRDHRLKTAGRAIENMEVRLVDERGGDVTASGGPGRPAGRGPLTCRGYYQDEAANRELFTDDGWMLMGDLVTIDDGYLTLVGRTSDIIIRGGKNISAVEVENVVDSHPDVELVSVVAVPDELFGERVCAVASLRAGARLELPDLVRHLEEKGVSKELYPEHLVVLDELPRASGAKVAKGRVREIARRHVASTGCSAASVAGDDPR